MKTVSLKQIGAALIAGVLTLAFNFGAQAASGSWLATAANANWTDSTNWSAAFPNSTNQTATFNNPLSGGTIGGVTNPIDITTSGTANIIVQNIVFSGNAGAYVIATSGSNKLQLRSAGAGSVPSFVNSISLTADVTNAQIIAANISFSAPSSTEGGYSFINNSTTTSATLTISGTILLSTANNRMTTLSLDGSNTGNNTISGVVSATGSEQGAHPTIAKNGTGTWILSGSNSFLANNTTNSSSVGVQVNAGVLSVQNNQALGTSGTANILQSSVRSGGTLELANNITLDNGVSINLFSGGTIRSKGNTTTNGRINLSATQTALSATLSTVNSSDVFTIGNEINDFTGGASDTVSHIAGPGTVVLTQSSNYAGIVSVDQGVLQLGSPTALGAATSANLAFGAGSTGKVQLLGNSVTIIGLNSNAIAGTPIIENGGLSAATLTLNNATASTFGGLLRDGAVGTLAFTKGGNGVLKLTSANTYNGTTNVTGGLLSVTNGTGSATGSNPVVLFSGTSGLTGNGIISAAINLTGTNSLTPGDAGIGTLTVGAITIKPSTTLNYEFGAGNDLLAVTTTNGLAINGGGFNFYNTGGTTPFSTTGTYNLITFNGAIGGSGVSSLGVLNAVSGKTYTFGTSGNNVTLVISTAGSGTWVNTGGGTYTSGTNWNTNPSVPSGQSVSVLFGSSITGPSVVNLDSTQTIGSLNFDNPNSYTLATGTAGSLNVDNGAANAVINIGQGSHSITAPVTLASNTIVSATGSLTISGNISNTAAAVTLTKNGSGSLVLLGSNSYGFGAGFAGTNLNGGTLAVANNAALGAGNLSVTGNSVLQSGAASLALPNNVILTPGVSISIDTNGNAFALNGAISGTSNTITLFNVGTLTLNGNNSGLGAGTVINLNAGQLVLGSSTALPNSVALGMGGATLDVNGNSVTSTTFAGSGTVKNTSAVAGASTLTLNLTGSSTFSGNITDSVTNTLGLTMNSGTLTLTGNNNYTGATTVASPANLYIPLGGVLTGNSSVTIGTQFVGGGFMQVAGGLLSEGSLNVHNGSNFTLLSGTAAFTGAVSQTDNGGLNSTIMVSGGNLTAASLLLSRTALVFTTQPAAGSTTAGVYQTGGTINISGSANIGVSNAGSNSSANYRIDGGVSNIGGAITVGLNHGGRWSVLDLNGGTLNSTDTVTGIQLGGTASGPATFLVRSGTATVERISMGQGNVVSTSVLGVSGGSLYIGSGGIVQSSTNSGFVSVVQFSGGTVGAKADWSSSVNTSFTTGTATIQAADASNTAHNITLNGVQSGAGSMTKTGNGTLTLAGLNNGSGSTNVNAGTLNASAYGIQQLGTSAIATTGLNTLTYASLPAGITIGQTITGAFGGGGGIASTTITSVNVGTNTVTTAAIYQGVGGADSFDLYAWQSLSSGPLTVDPSIVDIGASSQTVGAVTLISGTIQGVGGTLKGSSYTVYDGTISTNLGGNSASLNKYSAGTVLLNGNNSYSGSTTVSAGTLLVTGTHTNAGNYTVGSGGILGGTGLIQSGVNDTSIVVNSGGELSPGASAGIFTMSLGTTGMLDISGAVSATNSQSLLFELGANTPGSSDKITLTSGNLRIGTGALEFDDFNFTALAGFSAGTYILFETTSPANIIGTLGSNLNGQVGGLNASLALDGIGDVVLNVNPVPEPSTWAMLAAGTALLFALRRRKRSL